MKIRARIASERGFSLVELLVVIVLSGLVLAMVGGTMINVQVTQATVSDYARAANSGQLILRSIESGVRNASATSVTMGGTLLRTQVTNPAGSGTTCQAWFYDATAGRIYTTTAATSAGINVADAPTAWTLLGEQLIDSGTPGAFEATGHAVHVTLSMGTSGQGPIELVTTATPRLPSSAPPTNCLD